MTETATPEQVSHRLAEHGIVRVFAEIEYRHTATDCQTWEKLFYVDFDGSTVYASEPRRYSNSLIVPAETWHQVDAIPTAADFIGNYRKA